MMIRSRQLLSILATSGFALSISAGVAHAGGPCFAWGWDARCLTLGYSTGRMIVENHASSPMTYRTSEWHSHCGWPGGEARTPSTVTVAPGESRPFPFLETPDVLHCREDYVYDCFIGGREVRCGDYLFVHWEE